MNKLNSQLPPNRLQAGLGYLILSRDFNLGMAGLFAILLLLSALGIVGTRG